MGFASSLNLIRRQSIGGDVKNLKTAIDLNTMLLFVLTPLQKSPYKIRNLIATNIAMHVKGMSIPDAQKIVQECVEFYKGIFRSKDSTPLSFEDSVLRPIRNKLGEKK